MAIEATIKEMFQPPVRAAILKEVRWIRKHYQLDAVYLAWNQGRWHVFGRMRKADFPSPGKAWYQPSGVQYWPLPLRTGDVDFNDYTSGWVAAARNPGTAWFIPAHGPAKQMDSFSAEWALHNVASQRRLIWRPAGM